jgi:hypothetical protein
MLKGWKMDLTVVEDNPISLCRLSRYSKNALYGRTTTASPRCVRAASPSCFSLMNSIAWSCVTTAYEKKTGLKSISDPRRLNAHAISSRALSTSALAFFFSISARIAEILSSWLCPASLQCLRHRTRTGESEPENCTGSGETSFVGRAGRAPPHAASTRFSDIPTSDDPVGASDLERSSASTGRHQYHDQGIRRGTDHS